MADNSFSSYPSSPQPSGDISTQGPIEKPQKGQAQIINLPESIYKSDKWDKNSLRIEGQVTRSDPETNRVTIRTRNGDIEIQTPRNHSLPPKGANVELRFSHTNTQTDPTVAVKQLPSTPQAQLDEFHLNTQRTEQPPRSYQLPPVPEAVKTQTYLQLPPLQTGQAVRLLPLLPSQIAQIAIPLALSDNNQLLTQPLPTQSVMTSSYETSLQNLLLTKLQPSSLSVANTPNTMMPAFQINLPQGLQHGFTANEDTSAFLTQQSLSRMITSLQFLHPGSPTSGEFFNTIVSQPHSILPSQISNISVLLTPPKSDIFSLKNFLETSVFNQSGLLSIPSHITATVIGTLPQGQPVLAIRPPIAFPTSSLSETMQFFSMLNVSLPLGASINIPATEFPSSMRISPTSNTFPNLISSEFFSQTANSPVLNEIMQALQQVSPQIAQQLLQIIPSARTPAQIPPAILLFLAAVRGGDMLSWTGERSADILRRIGKSDLLTRLSSEFSTLSKGASEALPNDWRSMMFPFHGDDQIQKIVIFYKQDETSSDEKESNKKQTRFIFDMSLSRMGPVQIDGLFKPHEKLSRLDIVVRTETSLSHAMRQIMLQNFTTVLNQSNLTGELKFQNHKDNFVKIITQKENIKLMT